LFQFERDCCFLLLMDFSTFVDKKQSIVLWYVTIQCIEQFNLYQITESQQAYDSKATQRWS
jgi:hypothetical protein